MKKVNLYNSILKILIIKPDHCLKVCKIIIFSKSNSILEIQNK